ncbi:acetyl-CoA C-acyltransferase family protein [Govanella unica]|uniref:Acetyl-CoA C-acyltransferase family protein n=1 Tax=Govanella unica TaxID=2975056 RepID=A0A9X3TYQ7_9PROT|nr:acetyl-CoA C-acyltransferase family protein [Govania unica]MDA5194248.1 acetyl-CoA C-acyltransferase family protein [Govania unica]
MSVQKNDVVILSAVRTAIGGFGGSLKDVPLNELAAKVVAEAVSRAGVQPDDVQSVVVGSVIRTETYDAYLSRVAALKAGLPQSVQCLTVNRLCGSGLEAIVLAAQQIELGEVELAVAGGAENMSRSIYHVPSARWGQRMGDATVVDELTTVLTDPFGNGHMGVTAENVAAEYGISRETQDAFAVESHRRAIAAIRNGYFKDQILPIELKTRKGVTIFDTDEHPRDNVTLESLAALRPAFKKDGSVTAGNASGINDGASMLVLMDRARAEREGRKPLARIVSYARAGVDPKLMGTGPIPAVTRALERANLTVADMDVIESNEAFASQACAVSGALGFPADKVNPNGGAVALGHPVGASGAIITTKTIYELERTGGRYGLMTLCIGGGQGIAAVIERL